MKTPGPPKRDVAVKTGYGLSPGASKLFQSIHLSSPVAPSSIQRAGKTNEYLMDGGGGPDRSAASGLGATLGPLG
ncbi:hypothetical protein MTER_32910 [Mycolicibacter terrae]|uniref:Uncharacterized protein n=1 Tax=Mycolicibacter terrae TaxID=1788 RepID=A0AAD1I042_9MYCO|nr:hypothetical protein MTER_32910 [Mycolicibacter terrae]